MSRDHIPRDGAVLAVHRTLQDVARLLQQNGRRNAGVELPHASIESDEVALEVQPFEHRKDDLIFVSKEHLS